MSAFANRFELSCESKGLMLLYHKIWPCSSDLRFNQILKFLDPIAINVERVSEENYTALLFGARCFRSFVKNYFFLSRLIVEPESDHGFVFKTMASSLLQQNSDSTYTVRNFPLIVFSER